MSHAAITLAEKPQLREHAIADSDIWPEFNLHGETYRRLWPCLTEDLPAFQFSMVDEQTGEVIAEAHTVPCWWDGTLDGLSGGRRDDRRRLRPARQR